MYILKNSVEFLTKLNVKKKKTECATTIRPSNFTLGEFTQGTENLCSYKNVYMNFDKNFIHNNPKLRTTRCTSMCKWLNKPSYQVFNNKMQ